MTTDFISDCLTKFGIEHTINRSRSPRVEDDQILVGDTEIQISLIGGGASIARDLGDGSYLMGTPRRSFKALLTDLRAA